MEDVGELAAVPQEAMEHDLGAMLRGAIRASLEVFLQEELTALVGAEWYGRVGGRRDRRNGAYERRLLTSLGAIDVRVPRARAQGAASGVVGRYQRKRPVGPCFAG